MNREQLMKHCRKYEMAFAIVMEYWDSLPDEEKPKIHKRLLELGI